MRDGRCRSGSVGRAAPPRAAVAARRWCALACWVAAVSATAAAAEGIATATVVEPRAYGYQVGDVALRRIVIDVPEGLTLDPASVPQPGGRGRSIELHSVALRSRLGGRHHELEVAYQVFFAPREVRTFEMPAFELRFKGQPRDQTVRIDAWPLTVAPLTPVEAPMRRGLGELQPDAEPPRVDAGPARQRLVAYGVVAAAALAYLAHVYVGLPWWTRRRRPFGAAWRALRELPSTADGASAKAAYAALHQALNRSAGEVLFAPAIDRFLVREPRYAPLRSDLEAFFDRSRRAFFAGELPPERVEDEQAWLRAFCRRCRDLERGSA